MSLITSWYIPPPHYPRSESFPALRVGLRQRIRLHDLYFLDSGDVGDFAHAAGMVPGDHPTDPLSFAASLNAEHIRRIGDTLTGILADEYRGERVGLRPRFSALATYWPMLSLPDYEAAVEPAAGPANRRQLSVKAVRNSLRLAAYLGCRHVEVVGGSAIPESAEARSRELDPETYRELRLKQLATSLNEVFGESGADSLRKTCGGRVPFVSMEIEPGEAFLIKDLHSFWRLRDLLQAGPAHNYTLLNLDLAHLFLCQDNERGRPAEGPSGEVGGRGRTTGGENGEDPTDVVRSLGLREWIGHFHISDHARTHAADLTPGTYHFLKDYLPWLRLAVGLANDPAITRFSKVIAVELEACHDVLEAMRAMGRVGRWLEWARRDVKSARMIPGPSPEVPVAREGEAIGAVGVSGPEEGMSGGFLLVADIGRSTENILASGDSPAAAVLRLEYIVSSICRVIQMQRGSVLSFTGDGIIAFFDEEHFREASDGARSALEAAMSVRNALEREVDSSDLTIRIALHNGKVYVPSGGRLRHQALGLDVVRACRLCDWLGKVYEPALPPARRGFIFGCTQAFAIKAGGFLESTDFRDWGPCQLKGIPERTNIFIASSPGK